MENYIHALSSGAACAYQRYGQGGKRHDINQAVDLARWGICLVNNTGPLFPELLDKLGLYLITRYERTGEIGDLEEAIQAARKAIESAPDNHPNRAAMLNNLSRQLSHRYKRTGNVRDLEEAIAIARQAIEFTSGDHPERAFRLNSLGIILHSLYERRGEMSDLEEAIETARKAVELTPNDHTNRATWLSNLTAVLGDRYERTAEMRDLTEAIETARKAIESTPDDDSARATRLNNLGKSLESLYDRTGELRDLEEAIGIARQAVELTPDDHLDRALYLNNLGDKLESRYRCTGEMRDLEEAIETARKAVELTPDDHTDRPGRFSNLGNMLESWYERHKKMIDLEEAIQIAREAVKTTSYDHPDRARYSVDLGRKLEIRYDRTAEIRDLEDATTCLHDAWMCLNAVPFHRVRAAASCLKLLATQGRVDEAIDIGRGVLDILPTVRTRALDRNDQQFVMSTFAGVASDLCAVLLSANRLTEAIEYLEQGRAVIIGQLLDDRSDISSLCQGHSQLANQYRSLVDEISIPIRKNAPDVVEALLRKRRREALAELDICLEEIRRVPGHSRFMLGQTVAEMQEYITEGRIVVINITDFRSDAIIISKNSLKTIVPPELSASEARSWASVDWLTKKKSEQRRKNDLFLDYLSWLWYAGVKHIVAEISAPQTYPNEGLPRVWWIGSGLASSMPFHAAGIHTRGSKGNAYYSMLSSYTPSIKALSYAQKQAKRAHEALVALDGNTMLIASMPTSPRGLGNKIAPRELPGVEREVREIFNLTQSHIHATVHTHPSADQVLNALKSCRIAHFACHGTSDYSDPSNSGLILQKSAGPGEAFVQDRLTVRRVSDLRLKYAEIAYLSACSTAENKAERLSDEVIHVVSGFQVAGFSHVVGCLWPAGDSECAEVSKRFYSLVLKQSQSAVNQVASSLREAVMPVRAEDLSMPLNWAQFVHYGV